MTFASCSEKYNIMPILYQIIFVILTEFDGSWSSCGGSGFELCKNGWGFIFLFALKVKFLPILSINGVSPENAKWKIWAFMFFYFPNASSDSQNREESQFGYTLRQKVPQGTLIKIQAKNNLN